MKRVLISVFLLLAALISSKALAVEPDAVFIFTGAESYYASSQQDAIGASQTVVQPSLGLDCPCNTPYPNIGLMVVAAMAAWLSMASFIYGSQFIAAWIS